MRIAVCYICVTQGKQNVELAGRFCSTYHDCPPGVEHDLFVLSNGGKPDTGLTLLFQWIKAKIVDRENDPGWDISAYVEAATTVCRNYDLMICLGESVYAVKADWLKPIEEAYRKNGPGMYGVFSSNSIRAHLNTTAFACTPDLLREYPIEVNSKERRYEFEHGARSFWRRIEGRGYPVRLVTWDGVYAPHVWRDADNIMWKGDQSNCLLRCKHTDDWQKASPQSKRNWSKNADAPFR